MTGIGPKAQVPSTPEVVLASFSFQVVSLFFIEGRKTLEYSRPQLPATFIKPIVKQIEMIQTNIIKEKAWELREGSERMLMFA